MKKTAFGLVFVMVSVIPTPSDAEDSARCYNIREPDRRNACLAETRGAQSHCYSIKEADHRNLCLAKTTGERSRCYNIREKDLRASCLAGMGW